MLVFKMIRHPTDHGSLAVIRTLGRMGVPVYAAFGDPITPAAFSRYLVKSFVRPWSRQSPLQVLDHLSDIAGSIGPRPILLPTDDVAALFVDAHREVLSEIFCFPRQPDDLPRRLADKRELHELCIRSGIPSPVTRVPRSRDEFMAMLDDMTFPVVLKSMDPRLLRARPSAESVHISADRGDLIASYDRMEDAAEPNLMLQEYIPGGSESVWMFNGYFNERTECLFGLTGQKVRQAPPHTGATSLGVSTWNADVATQSSRFLRSIGYRGIVDMGFRYDARDGSYKLLDVNPRIGSTFRLFVDQAGMDVARAMYLDLTGQPVPRAPSRPRRWIVEDQDTLSAMRLRQEKELSLWQWLRSLRRVDEGAWWAPDDAAPLVVLSARWLHRLSAAAIGRLARRPFRRPAAVGADAAAARRRVQSPGTRSKSPAGDVSGPAAST